jgi:TPR repeat protein
MKGARQGNRVCWNNLGLFYKNGRGVERNIDTALKWFTKSAKKGVANAQTEAGAIHYIKGRHEEAVKWYKKAAAQGEMCAQSNLGNCYERGEGVKKDIPEALKWYGKAAEQGNAEAAKNILRLAKAMQVE